MLIGSGVSFGDRGFQATVTDGELIELSAYTGLFLLKLSPALLAQFFRMRAPHASKTIGNILRLQGFFKLGEAHLQVGLLGLHLS